MKLITIKTRANFNIITGAAAIQECLSFNRPTRRQVSSLCLHSISMLSYKNLNPHFSMIIMMSSMLYKEHSKLIISTILEICQIVYQETAF